jgi:hypothetical protein
MKAAALATALAALAALDLAQDLSRRAARLIDVAPKLRVGGKTGAIETLLADDAVSTAAPPIRSITGPTLRRFRSGLDTPTSTHPIDKTSQFCTLHLRFALSYRT